MKLDTFMRRLADGDRSAFKVIYDDTNKAVYYTALSILGERSLAEDAVQSAYLSVIKNAALYNPGTNARAWIVRIARNTAINLLNRRKREIYLDERENEALFGTYETDAGGGITELAKTHLGADEFNILMLAAVCGYKRREIAVMLEMPLSTVSWKYGEAIKKMTKVLGKTR